VSAHLPPGDPGSTVDWDALAGSAAPRAAHGGRAACRGVRGALAGGRAGDTPVAVVQDGTLPRQRTVVTTLAWAAARRADVARPAVVVIGEVVAERSP
jgi:uroporphyrin-III C-methyltransferase/precorrin-2 dehydrogenase/sirohydrochlorin ferrochelatase